MDKCEFIDTCKFYKSNGDSELVGKYCDSNSLHCGIFMVIQGLGNDSVPDDMKPDEKTRAYGIIAEG